MAPSLVHLFPSMGDGLRNLMDEDDETGIYIFVLHSLTNICQITISDLVSSRLWDVR